MAWSVSCLEKRKWGSGRSKLCHGGSVGEVDWLNGEEDIGVGVGASTVVISKIPWFLQEASV